MQVNPIIDLIEVSTDALQLLTRLDEQFVDHDDPYHDAIMRVHDSLTASIVRIERSVQDNPPTLIRVMSTNRKGVEQYLPSNYSVLCVLEDHLLVYGEDSHGWTAEGYVIPRLGSGLYAAHVVQSHVDAPVPGLPAP